MRLRGNIDLGTHSNAGQQCRRSAPADLDLSALLLGLPGPGSKDFSYDQRRKNTVCFLVGLYSFVESNKCAA